MEQRRYPRYRRYSRPPSKAGMWLVFGVFVVRLLVLYFAIGFASLADRL